MHTWPRATVPIESPPAAKRYVLLDRDGTLIVNQHYLSDPAGVELLPHAVAGLQTMQQLGLGLILVSNQSGIGRGLFSWSRLGAIHDRLTELLRAEGVRLDAIYVCPHHPLDRCGCRKPQPALAHRAASDFGFDLRDSIVIGDQPCDVALGQTIGALTFQIRSPQQMSQLQLDEQERLLETHSPGTTSPPGQLVTPLIDQPDFIVPDLQSAANILDRLLHRPQATRAA